MPSRPQESQVINEKSDSLDLRAKKPGNDQSQENENRQNFKIENLEAAIQKLNKEIRSSLKTPTNPDDVRYFTFGTQNQPGAQQ